MTPTFSCSRLSIYPRLLLSLVLSLGLATPAISGPSESRERDRPAAISSCPPNLVCYTLEEAAAIAHKLAELKYLQGKPRRKVLGLGVTLGPAVVLDVDQGKVNLDGSIALAFGLTLRF